ncbi:hypothetical protein CASFOL_005249 [Castilleja foliolosa]|uniref:Uncharacterized protein n=1 Tax=Castilleja foliolosa TaxID=1961234 RepID=A0ABD3E2Y7_9LAMI
MDRDDIDTRILRTIAIEHSNDVDAACLAVLTDILPFTTLRSTPGSPLSQSLYESQSSQYVEGSVLPIPILDNSMQAKTETQSNGEDVELDEDDQTINLVPKNDDDHLVFLPEPSSFNGSISQSSQILNMEANEEIIIDARNNKKTFFSEMEHVMRLMNEVKFREQNAEQAKIYDKAGDDIMTNLEVFKQYLQELTKSNNMLAGEVYPEKAMLATELEELQSRVLCLANERDELFVVLNEMRQALENRLAAAENVIISAKQQRYEKGTALLKAISDMGQINEKVAQESKILKQQAEENAKLREFLMGRGRVVNMLQQEIAGISNDVKLLKESFDDNVSFSKSISSSQSSCCILASSSKNLNWEELATPGGAQPLAMTDEPEDDACFRFFAQQSEGKSTAGDYPKELVDDGWVTQPEKDAISCFDQQSSTGDYRKELVEDGWELCDDSDV